MNFNSTVKGSALEGFYPAGWDFDKIDACIDAPEKITERQAHWNDDFNPVKCESLGEFETYMGHEIAMQIKLAKEKSDCVDFVALDAFRAEDGFVLNLAKIAWELGVKCITISDDAGVAMPNDFVNIVKSIKSICDIKVFVQPSDSLGLATACALEAVKAGADGIKTSVYGKYLSMSVFADIVRAKKYDLNIDIAVDVTCVKSIFNSINGTVEEIENQPKHTSVNNIDSSANLTEVSTIIKQLGYELSDDDIGKVYEEFKKLSAKKESIEEKELEALIASVAMQVPSTYHLVNYVLR